MIPPVIGDYLVIPNFPQTLLRGVYRTGQQWDRGSAPPLFEIRLFRKLAYSRVVYVPAFCPSLEVFRFLVQMFVTLPIRNALTLSRYFYSNIDYDFCRSYCLPYVYTHWFR